jgi:hypothetical protein
MYDIEEGDKIEFSKTSHKTLVYQEYKSPSEWRCRLFGINDLYYIPAKGCHPRSAFWRWMHYVCFGMKWEKYEVNKSK